MKAIGNIPEASVLGVEVSRYNHVPPIATTAVLWGVWCLPADEGKPQLTAIWREEAHTTQHLGICLTSTWKCPRCHQPFQAHRGLEADSFRAQRARDLEQASETPAPATRKKTRTS